MADIKLSIQITTDPVHEGGFSDNAADPGGATKYGVTQCDASAVWPDVNVRDLTLEQAQQFYLTTDQPERYNNPRYSSIDSQAVCNKLFDMGVLFGIGEAVECLQAALGIEEDGDFGTESLAALNAATQTNETIVIAMFKIELLRHVDRVIAAKPLEKIFDNGWRTRIRSDAAAPMPYKET